MKTLVTIDWDWFVPEKQIWDMGHSESLLFLNPLWGSRYNLRHEMVTNGDEHEFWKSELAGVALANAPGPIYVSDSHLMAYDLCKRKNIERVINIDAHHDCWPVDMTITGMTVGCHNWLSAYQQVRGCRIDWVTALWMDAASIASMQLCEHIDITAWAFHPKDGQGFRDSKIDGKLAESILKDEVTIHICRSGCWTPPWLDSDFIEFVRKPLVSVKHMQTGEWNPMRQRWTKKKEQEVALQQEHLNEFMTRQRGEDNDMVL